jgi:hypothetical protein
MEVGLTYTVLELFTSNGVLKENCFNVAAFCSRTMSAIHRVGIHEGWMRNTSLSDDHGRHRGDHEEKQLETRPSCHDGRTLMNKRM